MRAGACFQWPQPLLPPNPTTHHTRSVRSVRVLRRAISASFDSFFTDDDGEKQFVNRLNELTTKLNDHSIPDSRTGYPISFNVPDWPETRAPEFRHTDLGVEKRASSVELPVSLRLIKRRKRALMQEVGESACCSMNKAFSSMVFIIGELQTYAMRELNLNGILDRVQGEMHASFVWLFQRIFSCTPTLMLSLMLLLANFTVYHTGAVAAAAPPPTITASEHQQQVQHLIFDPKALSIGGGDGGGKQRPVTGATDDGGSDRRVSFLYRSSTNTILTSPAVDDKASAAVTDLWNKIEEDAMKMQAALRGEALMDPETLRNLVSPVTAEMEAEDDSVYLNTELMYFQAVSQDPTNALLLTNFAQFLFIVLHDLDRAEYYFKLALETEPRDAESLARYASFLWVARKNVGAAEEIYLEAIAADPANSFHSANYANFLWSTGGEVTCYPI